MKIQTAKSFLQDYGIKVLLTGQSGAGKTSSVKSLIKAGFKPVLISAESGLLSIADSDVAVIDISRDENGKPIDMKDRTAYLMTKVFPFLKEGKHDFDTVFLDSVTEVNATVMGYLNNKYPDAKDNLKKYGENSEIMRRIVKEFRDLKFNVVLVALSSIEKDDVGRRFTTADVVGKIGQELPAMFDEVLNLQVYTDEAGNIQRRIQCQPSEFIICKDRSGKLDMFEPNDLGQIFRKIKSNDSSKKASQA